MMSTDARPFTNVFACLVHERPECVVDLVENLRALDPLSPILLYDGGSPSMRLDCDHELSLRQPGVMLHPRPRPMRWGYLHSFALDCMEYALRTIAFDAITIVDSDQLCIRRGYSECLRRVLQDQPTIGMLGTRASDERMDVPSAAAVSAFREFARWRNILARFPNGRATFPQWTFWPSTVFTASAARGLVRLFFADSELIELVNQSQIWATEEVILPSLVAMLGYQIVRNPCDQEFVRFRVQYTPEEVERALANPRAFWIHPVPRVVDDPLRTQIRRHVVGAITGYS